MSSARELENAIANDVFVNTLVPHFKDYPALLGWYLADEPEAVTNWKTEPYSRLQNWYRLSKTIDPNHPGFCMHSKWLSLRKPNWFVRLVPKMTDNPFAMELFLDALRKITIPFSKQDSVPSSKAWRI